MASLDAELDYSVFNIKLKINNEVKCKIGCKT